MPAPACERFTHSLKKFKTLRRYFILTEMRNVFNNAILFLLWCIIFFCLLNQIHSDWKQHKRLTHERGDSFKLVNSSDSDWWDAFLLLLKSSKSSHKMRFQGWNGEVSCTETGRGRRSWSCRWRRRPELVFLPLQLRVIAKVLVGGEGV